METLMSGRLFQRMDRSHVRRATSLIVSGLMFVGQWSGWPVRGMELASAEIPQLVNYQGRLTENSGTAVQGPVTITFRLYDAASGGSELWSENNTVTLTEPDNGVFNVILGGTTSMTSIDFNQPIWLSVQVAGDSEMTPRQRMTAVGYAMNADKLDSLDSTSFLRTDVDTSTSGKLTITRSGTGLLIKPSTDPVADTKLIDVQNAAGTSKFSVDLEGDLTLAGNLAVTGTISGATSANGTTSSSFTVGSATDATTSSVSLKFGKTTGQESLVFDGASTGDFLLSDDLRLTGQSALRLADADSSNYVALKSPATVSSNVTWTLPSSDGTSNQVLVTDGSGNLSFASATSVGGDITAIGNCTSADCFTGSSGSTLTSTTSEVLNLGTDATLIFQRNDAGTVTFKGADDAGPADTVYTTTGAGAITVGGSSVTSITLSTDGTGTNEVVLPAGSIDGTEILDGAVVLGTDTSGSYVATASGVSPISVSGSGSAGAALTVSCPTCLTSSTGGSLAYYLAGTSGSTQTLSPGDTITIAAGTGITTTAGATNTVTIASTLGTSISQSEVDADALDFTELKDAMTLDADMALSQSTYTWTQSYTGTSGTGYTFSANSLTSGTTMSLGSTSTAGSASGSSKLLNLSRSGANASSSHTAYGAYASVTNTGTGATNVAGYFSASGGSNNYAALFPNGNVGFGTSTPQTQVELSANLASPYGGIGRYENLLTYSEAFDNAAWTKTNVAAITADGVTAPNGTATAEALAPSASATTTVKQTSGTTAAASRDYTCSVWAKVPSSTKSVVLTVGDSSTNATATVTFTTSWQRFGVTYNSGSSPTGSVFCQVGDATWTTGTIHLWGAQLEQSVTTPGVYVRATGSTITSSQGVVTDGVASDTNNGTVTSVATGLGLTGGTITTTGTVALDTSAALSGDHTLNANEEKFGQSGIIFEGSSADTIEGYLTVSNPTATDKTWTLPNATGTILTTGNMTDLGTTTFGSGSGIVWTFDASGGTDPAITFGNNSIDVTTGSLKVGGAAVLTSETGDISDVGSCSTGACFTAASPSSSLTFNNATSGTVTLQTVTGALGARTVSLPAATTTLVGTDTTDTLTNKTLTSPKIGTSVLDTNGNTLLNVTATTNAVNYLTYANAATGNRPTFTGAGTDTDVGVAVTVKGAGTINLTGDVVIDSANYNQNTAHGGLFIAQDPAAANSDGYIFLGRKSSETGGWGVLKGESSTGKLIWNGSEINIEGDSPAAITFGTGSNAQRMVFDATAGGTSAFSFTGGTFAQQFRNLVKNGSFEAFSTLETFNGAVVTGGAGGAGTFYRGGWDNFAPDEWVWKAGRTYQNAPQLFSPTMTVTATTLKQEFYDGKSALTLEDTNTSSNTYSDTNTTYGSEVDGHVEQMVSGLKPNMVYAVGAYVRRQMGTAEAIVDITGEEVSTNTTLTAALTSTDSKMTVAALASFPDVGEVLVDSERISYTGKDASASQLTQLIRGFEGTTAAAHNNGATVTIAPFKHLTSTDLADPSSFGLLKGQFVTNATASDVKIHLFCKGVNAGDQCRFDGVQIVAGRSVPEFAPSALVDTGDQTLYGSLRMGRSSDGRGGILSVDKALRSRSIEFFDRDPGMSGTTGGFGGLAQPVKIVSGTGSTITLSSGGTYWGMNPREMIVTITQAGATPKFKWEYRDCFTGTGCTGATISGGTNLDVASYDTLSSASNPLPGSMGVNVAFANTGTVVVNDQWSFQAAGASVAQQYNSYSGTATYQPGQSRIYKDPTTQKLTLQDGNMSLTLDQIPGTSIGSASHVDYPTFIPAYGGGGTMTLTTSQGYAAPGGTPNPLTFDVQICANGSGSTRDSYQWRDNRQNGTNTYAGDWDIACTQIPANGGPTGSLQIGAPDNINYGMTLTFGSPNGTWQDGNISDRWQVVATAGGAACLDQQVLKWNAAQSKWSCMPDDTGVATDAPKSSPYLVTAADATLTNERLLVPGAGLTGTLDTNPDPDTYTINFDASTLNSLTWGNNTQATFTRTFNVTGSNDPVITYGSNSVDVTTGVLKQGGTAVVLQTRTLTAGAGIATTLGDLSADRTITWNPATYVNDVTLWDSSQASRVLTAGLSGATDPAITFSNGIMNVSTGALQVGGTPVLTTSRTLTGGTGVDIDNSDVALDLSVNRTLSVDTTEIAASTFGSNLDFAWTFNASGGSDPVINFTNGSVDVTTGTLKQGGTAVVLQTRNLTGGPGIASVGDLTLDRTITWDPSTFVNNLTFWDGTQATRTLTANLSGITDPAMTFGNNSVDVTTGTLKQGGVDVVTISGIQTLTNKTIGATGLTFFGAATDVTTASNEDFTVTPNGTGNVILNGNVGVGATTPAAKLDVRGDVLTPTGSYLSPYGGIGRYENMVQRSEELDNAYWTKTTLTAADGETSPNGTTSGDLLTNNGAANGTAAKTGIAASASKAYTFSVWLKAGTSTTADLIMTGNGTSAGSSTTNCTLSTTWQRFSVTYTTVSDATTVDVTLKNTGANTQTIRAWGEQLEQSSTPGVYVRTTNAAVAASRGAVTDGVPTGTSAGTVTGLTADVGGTTTGATLTIAGGTNGIDTVRSSDTVTLNMDTTEIGTTTFGSGSGIVWTFDASGGVDPALTFGSGSIALNDGVLLDLSAINMSANTEGLKLPQNATACSSATADGEICWDNSADHLYVGTGAAAKQIDTVAAAYTMVQEEGSALTQRATLNFIGAALTAADNAGSTRTDVTLSQSPVGSTSVVGTGRTLTAGAGIATTLGDLSADRTITWDPSTFVNDVTLWDSSQASRVLTAGLSGATDPAITFSNGIMNVSTGALQVGGTPVLVNSRTLTGGVGIKIDGSDAALNLSADRTLSVDTTELSGNRTFGDASTDTITWTFDRQTGTDVTMQIVSGKANFNGLQVGGTDVVTTARNLTGGAGIAAIGDLSADRTITWNPTSFVNNVSLWDASQATRTLTANLSGSNDPVFTFSDGIVNLSTGALQQGGVDVDTISGIQTLTNKTIGSTGLTFSGAATDITTGTNEHLNLSPNGTGNVGVNITTPAAKLEVQGMAAASGTGTISSSGVTVTGNGAAVFQTQLHVGDTITASGQTRTVVAIASNSSLTTDTAFSPAISAGTAFTYQQPIARLDDSAGNAKLTVTSQGDVAVGADRKLGVEGPGGDTYMQYKTSDGKVWVYVNGQGVAWFKD